MKTKLLTYCLAALVAAGLLLAPKPVCASGCGIVPIKPIPPIGCRDLKAECICNSRGERCSWSWKCLPL